MNISRIISHTAVYHFKNVNYVSKIHVTGRIFTGLSS